MYCCDGGLSDVLFTTATVSGLSSSQLQTLKDTSQHVLKKWSSHLINDIKSYAMNFHLNLVLHSMQMNYWICHNFNY